MEAGGENTYPIPSSLKKGACDGNSSLLQGAPEEPRMTAAWAGVWAAG